MEDLDALKTELSALITEAGDVDALEAARISILGKKGRLTQLMKGLGAMAPDERKSAGAALNAAKEELTRALSAKRGLLASAGLDAKLAGEAIDITLPARPEPNGSIHPISQTLEEVTAIFGEMGFRVAEGPDIERDWYNFTALNIPPDHPARQEHDTFYLNAEADGERMVLRTHTSPVQIHTMESQEPPIRIIV
ncbi:MAG: phenylalanine--tRNA ligase subunit alpha, partial [Rhodospirillales bacterium]|nr:phenylalanine--tRNA ligase subunit alpha [Rhodospirillales bacterium]